MKKVKYVELHSFNTAISASETIFAQASDAAGTDENGVKFKKGDLVLSIPDDEFDAVFSEGWEKAAEVAKSELDAELAWLEHKAGQEAAGKAEFMKTLK